MRKYKKGEKSIATKNFICQKKNKQLEI